MSTQWVATARLCVPWAPPGAGNLTDPRHEGHAVATISRGPDDPARPLGSLLSWSVYLGRFCRYSDKAAFAEIIVNSCDTARDQNAAVV